MLAVIPAAGLGERLRPLTCAIPKPLVPVAGVPVIERTAARLAAAGVDRICLVVGHLSELLEDWADRSCPVPCSTVRQETADGLGSAVLRAAPLMSSEPVMVVLGDTIFDSGLEDVALSAGSSIGVARVCEPSRYGIVTERDGFAVSVVEKPEERVGDLAICGAYRFRSGDGLSEALERLVSSGRRTRGEFQLTDAIQLMIEAGEKFELPRIGRWFDCGTAASVLEANRVLLDSERGGSMGNPGWTPPVFTGDGAVIADSRLGPHASIGRDCRIVRSRLSDMIACDGAVIEEEDIRRAIVAPGGIRLHA